MTGAWHGGKGSDQRPEAEPGAFARGFDAIDWNARERESKLRRIRPDEIFGDPGPIEGSDAPTLWTSAP